MLVHDTSQKLNSVIRSLLLNNLECPNTDIFDTRGPHERILIQTSSVNLANEELESVSSQNDNCFSREDSDINSTIAHFFAVRIFEEFPQIVWVAFWREKEKVTFWTLMPRLDRPLRRSIYQIQEETILRFKEYKFDFYVISSVSAVPDSFTFLKNPRVR